MNAFDLMSGRMCNIVVISLVIYAVSLEVFFFFSFGRKYPDR